MPLHLLLSHSRGKCWRNNSSCPVHSTLVHHAHLKGRPQWHKLSSQIFAALIYSKHTTVLVGPVQAAPFPLLPVTPTPSSDKKHHPRNITKEISLKNRRVSPKAGPRSFLTFSARIGCVSHFGSLEQGFKSEIFCIKPCRRA